MSVLGQYVFNGLMLGMIYAMVAVGFTLFFGVLDVIKFSHGDVLMVGHSPGSPHRPAWWHCTWIRHGCNCWPSWCARSS